MRRAILLVALLLGLAGCVVPQEATEDDANATDAPVEPMGPPEPAPSPSPPPAPTPALDNVTPDTPTPTPTPSGPTTAPPPAPVPEPPTMDPEWPRNGSYVRYRTMGGSDDPNDPDHKLVEEAIITLTYLGGAWQGMCRWTRGEMTVTARSLGESVHTTNATGSDRVSYAPILVDEDARGVRDVSGIRACERDRLGSGGYSFDAWPDEWWKRETPEWWSHDDAWWEWDEPARTSRGVRAGDEADSFAHWDPKTGLLVAWRDARADRFTDGWIDATDAPLSEEIRSLPSQS